MKVLVKKMSSLGILKFQMVIGAIVMIAAMILLPVGIAMGDVSLLLNPYILVVVVTGMLMFGAFAYFLFVRPYFVYQKLPKVLAETDGEYVYVYGKKQAKIPLSAFDKAIVTYHLPFIYSKEFIAVLLTHLFSEEYGDLILDVPNYGSYKLHFVANVYEVSRNLLSVLRESLNKENDIEEK
jgi:hypothetical protein